MSISTSQGSRDICAIDFGTSNSGIAVRPQGAADGVMQLVPLEPEGLTMPTAVFFFADDEEAEQAGALGMATGLPRLYGRAAMKAYLEGYEGRLMRSMKNLLGSSLLEQRTLIGGGRDLAYLDVIRAYLLRLKRLGEAASGCALRRVVMGRPVYFVDDDEVRDQRAQDSLEQAARDVGFEEVCFEFEPMAAALDYEQRHASRQDEHLMMVIDIGGGTSDFCVIRSDAHRMRQPDRRSDILAHHGVHIAGGDFDRHLHLSEFLPEVGYRSLGPMRGTEPGREVPSAVFFDLATWHLINTVYLPQRVRECAALKGDFGDVRLHDRLMKVIRQHLGHQWLAQAEQLKIQWALGQPLAQDLGWLEEGLGVSPQPERLAQALTTDLDAIVQGAIETCRRAGLTPDDIDVLYFTGGSTGLTPLTQGIRQAFPGAEAIHGDRLSSVAAGLGWRAQSHWPA